MNKARALNLAKAQHSDAVRARAPEVAETAADIVEILERAPSADVGDIVTLAINDFMTKLNGIEPGLRVGAGHSPDRLAALFQEWARENSVPETLNPAITDWRANF